MSRNASDPYASKAVLLSGLGETSQVANVKAVSDTRAADNQVDCGVTSWSVAEYKMYCRDTLDAFWFRAIFSDRANSFLFDRRNFRCNTNIGE